MFWFAGNLCRSGEKNKCCLGLKLFWCLLQYLGFSLVVDCAKCSGVVATRAATQCHNIYKHDPVCLTPAAITSEVPPPHTLGSRLHSCLLKLGFHWGFVLIKPETLYDEILMLGPTCCAFAVLLVQGSFEAPRYFALYWNDSQNTKTLMKYNHFMTYLLSI